MSKEEKNRNQCALNDRLADSLAEEALSLLSDDDRRRLKVFVWTGCGMHKELNSVKGGDSAMRDEWKKYEVAPVLLANKDNAAVLALAEEVDDEDTGDIREETAAEKCARQVSKAGGVKLASLAGALLNHKDDKKGQQHTFRDYAESRTGHTFTFPDTSNTRYSTFLEAAAEILTFRDMYVDYMHIIRFSKEKQNLTNLEENVLKGIEDSATLTELACLALYQEAVSNSYICSVRGSGLETINALQLTSLQQKVKSHVKKLLENPYIILSPEADPREATMNGFDSWKRPSAVDAIRRLNSESMLPQLKNLFKAFLTGALTTWERFTAEFNDDGLIAALTEAEKDLAWMPATNDANEGALGAYRVFARKNPNGNLSLFNSIFRARRNNTEEFISAVLSGEECQRFLREQARVEDEAGLDRKRRRDINEEHIEQAATKKQKYDLKVKKKLERDEQVRSIEIETDCDKVKKMTVPQLKDQLDKFRTIYSDIPIDNKLKGKAAKLSAALNALDRYITNHPHCTD